jgi:hypothetical protein
MARGAEFLEGFPPFGQHQGIGRGLQRNHSVFELGHGGRLDLLANRHFGLVLRGHQRAGVQDVIVNEVEDRKDDGEVEQPNPPSRQFVVQFPDAIVIMVQQQRVLILRCRVHGQCSRSQGFSSSFKGSRAIRSRCAFRSENAQPSRRTNNKKNMQSDKTP